MNSSHSEDFASASVTRGGLKADSTITQGRFVVQCFDAAGDLKWEEAFDNGLTNQGKGHLLNWGLAGSAVVISARMAFLTTSTFSSTSTYAAPGPIVEAGSGVINTRGTINWDAAAGAGTVTKATSTPTVASIVGTATITGIAIVLSTAAVTTLGTVSDAAQESGVLYSVGSFGVSKSVTAGDTLNVSYSTSLT